MESIPEAYAANPVLASIEQRSSTRQFASKAPTPEQRQAVLHAATRAPSAGAMMMYSIIDIQEPSTLERLAVLCDNQPFIAKAPWALVFVVDYAKLIALFEHVGCFTDEFAERCGKAPRRAPHMGDFAIAAQDAVIAAQTAAIAAEAVGLGSCYIGDVVEQAEQMAELLKLPPHTMPLSMLGVGWPRWTRCLGPMPQSPASVCATSTSASTRVRSWPRWTAPCVPGSTTGQARSRCSKVSHATRPPVR